MVNIGFIHGRFQLFHNDHLKYALAAKEKCNTLIIGITSPNNSLLTYENIDPHRSNISANPFTYYERFQMIKASLLGAGVRREDFEIVPFPIESPSVLQNYIPLEATSFFTIYDEWGNEKLRRLSDIGYKTNILWSDRKKDLSSTMIRQLIISGERWECYVPREVYNYIKNNNLEKRIIIE